ncbi:MAG: alpha/beta hydrolase [Clostridiales bacterium]|nr:alpha/beta hydrolase [Clostridiales bacterium]
MICKTLDLGKEYGLKGGKLSSLCIDMPFDQKMDWKRPAVIVVPGGGYGMCSKREAETVAAAFLARGFQTFILTYTTVNDGVAYPEQLLELAAAFDYVRKNAEEYSVNPEEVFAVGFSAGGHLVANISCEHMRIEELYGKPLDCKPTAVGLSYPVIYNVGHIGSYINLTANLPEEEREALINRLCMDELVTQDTPPAFIWSTFEDSVVTCENALRYATALKKANVRFALHIYPFGEHGLSTSDREISCMYSEEGTACANGWVDECCKFFRIYVQEPY